MDLEYAAAVIDEIQACDRLEDLQALMGEVASRFGFSAFALVHHVPNPHAPPDGALRLTNYPERWQEAFTAMELYSDDPVHALAQRRVAPFMWRDVPRLLSLTRRQRATLHEAASFGLAQGYTVPLHGPPGDLSASASFVESGRGSTLTGQIFLTHLTMVAAERARELSLPVRAPRAARPMTDRQRDCMVLAARGKSDFIIARLLGISPNAVKRHIEAARERYGVASRIQLLAHLLMAGEMTWRDIFRVQRPDWMQGDAMP
jgi:LuxR family transcriptional regulator, quorum-sensing system regulator CciR